jgi:hypothetical protein
MAATVTNSPKAIRQLMTPPEPRIPYSPLPCRRYRPREGERRGEGVVSSIEANLPREIVAGSLIRDGGIVGGKEAVKVNQNERHLTPELSLRLCRRE